MMWDRALAGRPRDQFTRDEPMARSYRPLPPAEILWDTFDYKPLTGELIWRIPPRYKARLKDKVVGCPSKYHGYQVCTWSPLGRAGVNVHRLVYLWVTGIDPLHLQVDHKSMNRRDNRFHNLRLSNQTEQLANRKQRTDSLASYKGVQSRIKGDRIIHVARCNQRYLGQFPTAEAAHDAYCEAAKLEFGEFWRAS